MSCLSTFPSTSAIPPAEFYNIQGLTNWLNNNPTYKQYFICTYPYLISNNLITSTLSSLHYNVNNVPLAPNVVTLSQSQSLLYNQQLQLFRKVYAHNSNAYVNYICSNTPPIYYTFKSYNEKNQYTSSVSLVNKLYPFKAMAEGPNWQVPFPIYS